MKRRKGTKRKKKKRMLSEINYEQTGVRGKHKRWNEELTSGTVKLMAISSRRG